MQKLIQFNRAVVQPAGVCNSARKFAGESEIRGRHFHPPSRQVRIRGAVKGRIDFYSGKVTGVKLQPP